MSTGAPRIHTPDSVFTHSSFFSAVSTKSRCTSSTNSSGPDSAVLSSFIAELGIHESEEDEFAWIAEFGLRSDLPPGWSARTDAAGANYYVNNDSLESTWEHPLAQHLRRVVEIGRGYLEQPEGDFFQDRKSMLWQEHKAELDDWHGPLQDDEGNSYFVNSRDNISSWQDPRAARQYVFDFQCSLLSHLQSILSPIEESSSFQGGTPWETVDGAQVLSLDRSQVLQGNLLQGNPARRLMRRHQRTDEYDLTFKRMSNAAVWLQDARRSEEDIQRMKLIHKVEERRMRKLNRKLRETIGDTIQENDEKPPTSERRPSRARGKL